MTISIILIAEISQNEDAKKTVDPIQKTMGKF